MSGEYVTKQRDLKPLLPLRIRYQFDGYPATNSETFPILTPSQVTRSWVTTHGDQLEQKALEEDLRIFRNGFTSSDPLYDRGHEFSTTKTSAWYSHADSYVVHRIPNYGGLEGWTRGPLVPDFRPYVPQARDANGQFLSVRDPYPVAPGMGGYAGLGTRAIKLAIPTLPQASIATMIGELFEGLPQMIGHTFLREGAQYFRGIGGEYLNAQFGWAPFISDLQKLVRALREAGRITMQLRRDSGRQVRRRITLPSEVTTSAERLGTTSGPFMFHSSDWYPATEQRDIINRITRTTRDVWFAGAFSYFFPVDDSTLGKLQSYDLMANRLLGTRVTPEVLWELAPWSWLVDWKFNIGNVLTNASALSSDSLVMRYGYLMVRTTTDVSYQNLAGIVNHRGVLLPAPTASFRRVTKQRMRATPYGFGLREEDLSSKQWAILAALGMSRSPKGL